MNGDFEKKIVYDENRKLSFAISWNYDASSLAYAPCGGKKLR